MRISFHGAAGEVTGSCYLIESGPVRFLLDCGMFQGGRESQGRNRAALDPLDPRRLDFVVLSHAHLDHCGLLPRLVTLGFRGPVYCTAASADLAAVILLDSAHIQEKEAEWALRQRHRHGSAHALDPAPLYTVAQAHEAIKHLKGVDYAQVFEPAPGVRCRLSDAGHILGSSIVELWLAGPAGERKVVFSGDLGQPARPVLRDPQPVDHADVLLVESTYGNRTHRSMADTEAELVQILDRTLVRGNVVIPAFSVGRTQELLFVLTELTRSRRIRAPQIYVDSPMALAATEITYRHESLLDAQTRALIAWQKAHPEAPPIRFAQTVEESIALNEIHHGAVIISASGMCDAGRIKYHLLHNLPRPECAVVIAGFQAVGTLGRRLVDGAREVRLFGERVPVRARVHTVGGLSAHADQEGLLGWLAHFRCAPRQVFVVHGERATADTFAEAIRRRLGWTGVSVPQMGEAASIA